MPLLLPWLPWLPWGIQAPHMLNTAYAVILSSILATALHPIFLHLQGSPWCSVRTRISKGGTGASVYLFGFIFVCISLCVWMWRSEVSFGCLLQLTSTLDFETESLNLDITRLYPYLSDTYIHTLHTCIYHISIYIIYMPIPIRHTRVCLYLSDMGISRITNLWPLCAWLLCQCWWWDVHVRHFTGPFVSPASTLIYL